MGKHNILFKGNYLLVPIELPRTHHKEAVACWVPPVFFATSEPRGDNYILVIYFPLIVLE